MVNITYQQINRVLLSDLLGSLTEMELQQWIKVMNWKEMPDGYIFINNQEGNVKTKNITEKIGFDSKCSVRAVRGHLSVPTSLCSDVSMFGKVCTEISVREKVRSEQAPILPLSFMHTFGTRRRNIEV